MVSLLDVNVLVALVVPEHEHHDATLAWYRGKTNDGWATCAVTELVSFASARNFPAARGSRSEPPINF